MFAASRFPSVVLGCVVMGLVGPGGPVAIRAEPAELRSALSVTSAWLTSSGNNEPGQTSQTAKSVSGPLVTVVQPKPAVRGLGPALIEYQLAKDVEAIAIEILDGSGGVIRRVSGSEAEDAVTKEASANAAQELDPKTPGAPPRRAGLNRYEWDLRYQGPVAVADAAPAKVQGDAGPMALPGDYRVRVSVGSERAECPLAIAASPHSTNVALDDLKAQLTLALDVRDATSRANEAVNRIRALKSAIAARVPNARSPVIGLAADATSRSLGEVEGELTRLKTRKSGEPLNERLSALRKRIEGADARPTDADKAEFAKLSTEVDTQLQRLAAVEENHIVAFNRLLTNGGLEPVSAGTQPPK